MPSTSDHGLRYPGPDDAPDGPTQMKNLADDTDAALTALVPDSGVLTNLPITAGTGWSVAVKEHRIIGKKMNLHLVFTRDGANLTANSSGNIGDELMGTITDANLRPVMDEMIVGRANLTSGSAQINSADGAVKLVDAHSGSTISIGNTVQLSASYFIP